MYGCIGCGVIVDGGWRDCWIEIVPGIAGKKEYSDAPFVKIVQ